MEANHPNLTTQKSFYVEISRARHNAELVTDDATALRERLETATGERVAALEAIGGMERERGAGTEPPQPGSDGAPKRAPDTTLPSKGMEENIAL